MLFNSLEFAIFLPLVFLSYWFFFNKNVNLQNFFLFLVSSIFYGWWDWHFLFLLYFTSMLDYVISLQIEKQNTQKIRKFFLGVSIFANLGVLGFFKYYNFFVQSWIDSFALLGITMHKSSLNIILPVGISFYTFQSMSYTIDVYRNKLVPPKNIISFLAFVSFFPQLVAGPIERASNMLPQFYKNRNFNYEQAKDGLRQILWGLFKKVIIADTCAIFVNEIFENHEIVSGSTLALGSLYFAFQIYGDFSGYSDIALGTAKLFGFDLMVNFRTPYFSRDIAEFWRRWHISLSSWFRDYVYIPLGGSKGNMASKIRNVLIIFIISGFWHGANWTYISWGTINGLLFIPLLITGSNRNYLDTSDHGKLLPSIKETSQIILTFFLVCIGWIFFRAKNISQALEYISGIFSKSLFSYPKYLGALPWIIILVLIEWFTRAKIHPFQNFKGPLILRWIVYAIFIFLVIDKQINNTIKEFIYFQF